MNNGHLKDFGMTITIDGVDTPHQLAGDLSFEDIMKNIHQKVNTPERAITLVKLDGVDVTGKDWNHFTNLRAAGIRKIDITTSDPKELTKQTTISLIEFIEKLKTELIKSANSFRLGDYNIGSEIYSNSLEGIQLICHTSKMIARQSSDDDNSTNLNSLEQAFLKLDTIFRDLLVAQEVNDWLMLADIVEHELVAYLDEHKEMLVNWS